MAKKTKCFVSDCSSRVAMLIGDCKYCKEKFCGFHRLPESHKCSNMNGCKQEHFERNQKKVMDNKCVGNKLE